ncbi:MAG: sulfite exporter TauE/SafE family protein [Rubripirellula sp.]
MLTLAMGVMFASLLGSLHCVGMCGPFALWATQGGCNRHAIACYHLGRLTTFLSAGLAAGVLGSAVTIGGDVAGLQMLAAKVAGGFLIFFGIARLLLLMPMFQSKASVPAKPSRISMLLQQMKPLVAGQGPLARAYLGGLLTTWLPCGWLYLFLLVAAGTGDVLLALTVMTAFWVGTLPALTALTLGAHSLIPRFRRLLPVAASLLLIATGFYTATGRASADLSRMVTPEQIVRLDEDGQIDASALIGLKDEPLPCCEP